MIILMFLCVVAFTTPVVHFAVQGSDFDRPRVDIPMELRR